MVRLTSVALLLSLFLIESAVDSKPVFQYKVCGDLPSQLTGHISAISHAIRKERPIEIADNFLVDESVNSTTSLSCAIDTDQLVEKIWALGVEAKVVKMDPSRYANLPCFELRDLEPEDTETASILLQALQPSKQLGEIIDYLIGKMKKKGLDISQGVCLHHPSGKGWDKFCNNWNSPGDGLYRGNCKHDPKKTLLQLLRSRSLFKKQRWVYYVGDGVIPLELLNSEHDVFSRIDLADKSTRTSLQSQFGSVSGGSEKNLWLLIDFMICRSLPHFVGNSIDFWSSLQIAFHQLQPSTSGSAYWYNSQNIPLADTLPIYQMPFVYTYTELSAGAGKYMLKASISSVKRHMPRSKIHIIYHGSDDIEFKGWLESKGAILHNHNPAWRKSIEQMRLNGDQMRSHLFLHEGNYFGTWQRIDIPKFIDSEYCLLLDADTIVRKPFTMSNFGPNITKGLAFSAEADPYLRLPWNAGISLINVPFLRETHSGFIKFIMKHVDGSPYDPDAPSDQGAYLDFYKGHVDFLSIEFNFKPYFQVETYDAASARILHFHGPKPHHYIGHFMGLPCDAAAQHLCDQAAGSPFLCQSISAFAGNLLNSGDDNPDHYCRAVHHDNATADVCTFLLQRLGKHGSQCTSLADELQDAKVAFERAHPLQIKQSVDPGIEEFKYNVCNGLCNQLVYHTIGIAEAIRQKRPVAIFDSFIYYGVQNTDDNVLPTADNSVPLGNVFDIDYLFGKIADYGIEARLVASDWDLPSHERVPCIGMTPMTDDQSLIAMELLQAFRPHGIVKEIIDGASRTMIKNGLDMAKGVCVHHRDGQDWHDHCARWGSIPDGIYRGNCLNETSFVQSLERRALRHDSRWVYYVGDHETPQELTDSKYSVVSKDNFLDTDAMKNLRTHLALSNGPVRELFSVIDFFMCKSLNYFVGNSVSSWSAVQIAIRQKTLASSRDSGTYWYNSQSIPLANFLPLYQIPIVFVYTELSPELTKYHLRVSISSVKTNMPKNRITVLYHGNDDTELKTWLRRQGVVLYQHSPKWRPMVHHAGTSYGSGGSRKGTVMTSGVEKWQMIDVPNYVESEYCLLLDPGFVVQRAFTMADFELDLTLSLAFLPALHGNENDEQSSTGRVSLLNIPHLRRTYDAFLTFAQQRMTTMDPNNGSATSAYSEFYNEKIQLLPSNFGVRPYETISRHEVASPIGVYFDRVKPHQFVGHIIGIEYGEATDSLCRQALEQHSYLCPSVQSFGKLLLSSSERDLPKYCKASFAKNPRHQYICARVFKTLAAMDEPCEDLPSHVLVLYATAALERPLDKELASSADTGLYDGSMMGAGAICGLVWLGSLLCSWFSSKRSKRRRSSLHVIMALVFCNVLISALMLQSQRASG